MNLVVLQEVQEKQVNDAHLVKRRQLDTKEIQRQAILLFFDLNLLVLDTHLQNPSV